MPSDEVYTHDASKIAEVGRPWLTMPGDGDHSQTRQSLTLSVVPMENEERSKRAEVQAVVRGGVGAAGGALELMVRKGELGTDDVA